MRKVILRLIQVNCSNFWNQLISFKFAKKKRVKQIKIRMQQSFSAEEIKIIEQFAQQIEDNEQLSIKASQVIKAELNINRTPQEIKNFLYTVDKKELDQSNKIAPERSQGSLNLFKTFKQPEMIIEQAIPSLARPVPRRKPQLNFQISKRKVVKKDQSQNRSSWSLQQRLNQIQQINEQCTYIYDKVDRKINRKQSTKQQNGGVSQQILWFYHQYFYSNYDRKYFQFSHIKEVYQCLGLKFGEATYRQHRDVLRALGVPKIFNEEFILEEKNRLEQYRNSSRVNTKNLSKSNQNSTQFPVHSIVLALNPLCGHLHIGSIMAYYKQNLYMVRFLKPQLPAHKILDTNMSTQFTSISNKQKCLEFESQKILSHNSHQNTNIQNGNSDIQVEIVQNVNFQITGYLIKILEYKAQLVKVIRFINDRLDKKENLAPEGVENGERGVLGWVVAVVARLDALIREGLLRFRLRGVNQSNNNSIFSNLKELLINPLKIMSKEFENSNEQPDINAAQQIKQIINKQRDNQIRKAINNAIMISNNSNTNSCKEEMNISAENVDKKNMENMMPFLYSCLGILADLRYEGKQFDIENNRNLLQLADLTGKENSQAFNEVYEKLYSIVTKVRE